MTNLLVFRERLKNFYSKNETYFKPALKFLMALISMMFINGSFGYMNKINNIAVVLLAALMCSFLPLNMIIIFSAVFFLLHLYALSMECAIVVFAVFLLLFLLYFRFTPKDTIVVLLAPLCFIMKIPYVIPLALGILGTPVSVVSVSSGVIVYYMAAHIKEGVAILTAVDPDGAVQKFRYVIDGLINNKAMLVTLAAFAFTVILVYTIRRMNVDHAWTIALAAGALTNLMILLLGDMIFDTKISIAATILGTLVSFLLAKVIQFFAFNLDYSRTELVQFEDDEYYYYIKAVPKISLAEPEKRVKKINSAQTPESVQHRNNSSGRTPGRQAEPPRNQSAGTRARTGPQGGRTTHSAPHTRTNTRLK